MQAFVPKHRKPKFNLHLKIYDVNNLPYVSGHSYVKWHLAHPATAEQSKGHTDRSHIKEHKVTWNYETEVPIKLVIDKNGMLQDSSITFEIRHEIKGTLKLDSVNLGSLKLNLAEYVETSELEGEDGVTKRYLLQESKINCTMKVGIYLKQIDGDRNYISPPMKTAQVFTGISGILIGEPVEGQEANNELTLSTKKGEFGADYRDLYRRTIAANWTCMPGEPPADRVIEDIFNGGDGWCNGEYDAHPDQARQRNHHRQRSAEMSDSTATLKANKPKAWGFFRRGDRKKASQDNFHKDDEFAPSRHSLHSNRGRNSYEDGRDITWGSAEGGQKQRNYFVESDLRTNLREWNLRKYEVVEGRDTRDI